MTQLAAQFVNKDAVLLLLEHGLVDISLNLLDWGGKKPSACRFCLSPRMNFWDINAEFYSLTPNIESIDGVKYILLSLLVH